MAVSADPTILITGATGFIGGAVTAQLLSRTDLGGVLLLIRAANQESARNRALDSITRFEDRAALSSGWPRCEIIVGDLTDPTSRELITILKGEQQDMGIAATGYMIVVVVMSLVCFIAYGIDKRQAANGGRRVSEPTLHLMAFLGGWPGALMGQRHFRHKTQKATFRIVFWIVVVLHVGIVGAVTYALVSFT
jgi:uncharacterized membrane protein YsdA (DUF1294 family)